MFGQRFLVRQLHVFDKVLYKEARLQISLQDAGGHVAHLGTACRSGRDGVQHGLRIQSNCICVSQGLARSGKRARNGDLVAHLGVLAISGLALIIDVLSHGLK